MHAPIGAHSASETQGWRPSGYEDSSIIVLPCALLLYSTLQPSRYT